MTVNYTTNLALGQPVTGTESGTWGDDVNNSVTSYLDIAIAGGLAITVTTTDVTLTLTQGTSSATNIGSTTAQYAILNVSGAMTAARNLIVPSSSRQYVINNNTTGGFALTVKGSATSGVTLVNGEKAHVFWNGSDYAKLSNTPGGAGTFSSITNTGLTSGRVVYSTTGGLETDSANLTFNGTILTSAGFSGPLNGTVGATTPATGAFTTLSATGVTSVTGASNYLAITTTGTPTAGSAALQLSVNGTNSRSIRMIDTAGSGVTFDFINRAQGNAGSFGLFDDTAGVYRWVSTSTGLAVTGALSATTTGQVGTTLGVGNATPSTSGAGITFPATQSASSNANTLDDYEEGTWTPTYTASTTNPTMQYNAQFGSYTKVGRLVTCYVHLRTNNSSTGGGVGDLQISGLPFTSASIDVNGGKQSGCIGEAANFGAANFPNAIIVKDNSSSCNLLLTSITTSTTNVNASTLTLVNQGNSLFGAFSYIT